MEVLLSTRSPEEGERDPRNGGMGVRLGALAGDRRAGRCAPAQTGTRNGLFRKGFRSGGAPAGAWSVRSGWLEKEGVHCSARG
ncbi:hypothetical protein GCM10010507_60840 [Streptomyces cinnamoneus]|uniref:Uncharacterized protein n=1 Tax=Streptomyces cinnamoneus TaxID=53446 RepID=A0A918WRN5_STRCJ|nr:hypothetical protein GCM10010507_60840 [Streptomyces cinnamoneus]